MDDARDQAKERFARLQRSVQPHLTQLQGRMPSLHSRSLSNTPPPSPGGGMGVGLGGVGGGAGGEGGIPIPAPFPPGPPPPPALTRAPALSDPAYNHDLAALASKVLYRSGTDPVSGGPLLVLCAAAFPDANMVDYTVLLPYVLSNLPGEDELNALEDGGYSVIFFAGGGGDKKGEPTGRPTWKWTLQAYTLVGVFREIAGTVQDDRQSDLADGTGGQLGRAVRKKIRKLWVVHEKNWIRAIFELMANVVSPKFKKKVVHLNTLTDLALHIDITKIRIPPAVYLYDRKLGNELILPGFPKAPVFGNPPFQNPSNPARIGDSYPLPVVLVDTSNYIRRHCLNVEGIFRVPPSQALLEVARQCYDRHTSLQWDEWGPHTAAGLIKLYYRSLPEPMIPVECYEQMQSLVATETDPERAMPEEELKEVRFEVVRALLTNEVTTLPVHSRILFLRHLLPLLSEVAAHGKNNKMNATNLAVCVAASLARSNDMVADAKASAGIRKFVEIGIERIEELAPKLPLRRGGVPRHRTGSSISSIQSIARLSTQSAIIRKPVPSRMVSESPVSMMPSQELYEAFKPTIVEEQQRRASVPPRSSSYDAPKAKPERSASVDQYQAYHPSMQGYPAPNPAPPAPAPAPVQYQAFTPVAPPALPPKPAALTENRAPSKAHTPAPPPKPAALTEAPTATTKPPSRPRTPSFAPSIADKPSVPPQLPPPRKLSATHLAPLGGGTFQRPALRRVASANLDVTAAAERARSNTISAEHEKPPQLRRVKSQMLAGPKAGGVGVKGLREMFEQRSGGSTLGVEGSGGEARRRYSSVGFGA
ncbi:hypothetical protein FN846DRAFT_888236 [Sphaerosporella brunnea]|uniref:Rho-GAP domain-containing protein n=1 Tax=Sphaerosporella brunnea TaxID=1250544 RepID=A0A5J5F3G0_9PEZI|nr:hypothetical protein FN846DRAFT_888236 [Sphaerosporella brunnea]